MFAGIIAVHYATFLFICILIAMVAGQDEIINKKNERLANKKMESA